jgi:hypothetical protein
MPRELAASVLPAFAPGRGARHIAGGSSMAWFIQDQIFSIRVFYCVQYRTWTLYGKDNHYMLEQVCEVRGRDGIDMTQKQRRNRKSPPAI